jgi:hypothetical protein
MIKNTLNVLSFFFIIFFIYFVFSTYFSDQNKLTIKNSRDNFANSVAKKMEKLEVLQNDTDDVIEFNTGFNDKKSKIKRNFWDLLKK